MKRFLLLLILLGSCAAVSCIPAIIGVAGWYSLTVKDKKQILADKAECEEQAMKVIDGKKKDIQAKPDTETTLREVDDLFQKEFTACMKAKSYYKTSNGDSKSN